jgi:hypothetical protein
MRIIPVESFPPPEGYDTIDAAIAGAMKHPRQSQAVSDTSRLRGAAIVDACWTDTDFVIRFSNGRLLHVFVSGQIVDWRVTESMPDVDDSQFERVGAEPVTLRWRSSGGDEVLDRSAMTAKRRGCDVERLFVNELGFLVDCRGQLIWWFMAVRRRDSGCAFLHVSESD